MRDLLLVFLGGGLGSIARFLVARMYAAWNPSFPFATLSANFLSCVVFGFVIMLGTDRLALPPYLKLLLLTGFCGGFSTFSSFTFETVELFRNGSSTMALSNILLNLILSIAGLYSGIALARIF